MKSIAVHIEDNSQEALDALENAVERGAMAIGEKAVTYVKDNIERQHIIKTGRLLNSITYMVKEE